MVLGVVVIFGAEFLAGLCLMLTSIFIEFDLKEFITGVSFIIIPGIIMFRSVGNYYKHKHNPNQEPPQVEGN